MTPLSNALLLVLPSAALGAALMGIVGLPLAHRRGIESGRREHDDVARILGGWDAPERSLTPAPPSRVWAGPRALLHRAARLRLDRLFVGLWTEPIWLGRIGSLLDLQPADAPPVPRAPIGAEPASVAIRDRSGLASPAAGSHEATAVAEVTGEFWEIVGSTLFEQGLLEVDATLALPCSHCELDPVKHVGCVGCACPCKLTEVA